MTWVNYWIVGIICRILSFCLFRLYRINTGKLEPGPRLLVCNHISHFDPPILTAALPRKLDYMAMKDLFQHPLANFFFKVTDVFPVDREKHDAEAVRTAVRRLKAGRIVLVFPEKGIRSGATSVLEGAHLADSAAVLAKMAGCPVQTCALVGSDQLYDKKALRRRPRMFVSLGRSFHIDPALPSKEARQKLTADLEKDFQRLFSDLKKEQKLTAEEIPTTAQQRWARA